MKENKIKDVIRVKNIEQFLDCTNIGTFFLDNNDKFFRLLVYRKVYTPYEVDKKYSDESMFESDSYELCKITKVIETAGDVLLECSIYYEDYLEQEDHSLQKKLIYSGKKEYYKLSEIKLTYFDNDNIAEN